MLRVVLIVGASITWLRIVVACGHGSRGVGSGSSWCRVGFRIRLRVRLLIV